MGTEATQDLKSVGPQGTDANAPVQSGRFEEETFDPQPQRENVRGRIALSLVWAFVAVVFAIVVFGFGTTIVCGAYTCSPETVSLTSIRIVVELVITPLVGLVGAVAGFYFGEKSASGRRVP